MIEMAYYAPPAHRELIMASPQNDQVDPVADGGATTGSGGRRGLAAAAQERLPGGPPYRPSKAGG